MLKLPTTANSSSTTNKIEATENTPLNTYKNKLSEQDQIRINRIETLMARRQKISELLFVNSDKNTPLMESLINQYIEEQQRPLGVKLQFKYS